MRTAFLVVIATLGVCLATGSPACGQVVINELMADPASDWSPTDGDDTYGSLNDEWLEILNVGSGSVDMRGWRLRDAVSDSSWRYEFDVILPAGAFMVVYGNEAYDWQSAAGFSKSGLSLNNAGDTVTLVRADLSTVVDQVVYTGSEVRDDCSYGRAPDAAPDWQLYDGLNPTDPPASGMPPTPGGSNIGSPVADTGWGVIKALYR